MHAIAVKRCPGLEIAHHLGAIARLARCGKWKNIRFLLPGLGRAIGGLFLSRRTPAQTLAEPATGACSACASRLLGFCASSTPLCSTVRTLRPLRYFDAPPMLAAKRMSASATQPG